MESHADKENYSAKMQTKKSSTAIRESSSMIASMVKAGSRPTTDRLMKACMLRARSAFKVNKRALTGPFTKVNSRMIFSTGRASSSTRTASQAMKVNGTMGRCMGRACISGVTGVATRVSTSMTRRTGLECTCGQMGVHITACGRMETRTARAPKSWQIWI